MLTFVLRLPLVASTMAKGSRVGTPKTSQPAPALPNSQLLLGKHSSLTGTESRLPRVRTGLPGIPHPTGRQACPWGPGAA